LAFGAGYFYAKGKISFNQSSPAPAGNPPANPPPALPAATQGAYTSGPWFDHESMLSDQLEHLDTHQTASDPIYQWVYTVIEGDTAGRIAEKHVGNRGRYVELITVNPQKKWITNPEINFAEIVVGEKLYLPKSWNPWISKDGVPFRNGPLPPYDHMPAYPALSPGLSAGYAAWPPEDPSYWKVIPFAA
jgi:hypothetical protein